MMERPTNISSSDAMRWNNDVERRRLAHHERRCAEDALYKRAYERQKETMLRLQKHCSEALTQMAVVMDEERNIRCQEVHNVMDESIRSVRRKSHEEVMRERAMMYDLTKYGKEGIPGNGMAAAFLMCMMLSDGEKLRLRMREIEEEKPYAEEIHRTDEQFDKELIRMSGFMW